ncbi:hypothetical protein EDB81DRAFT_811071 [Dactylonectria macrodidyma]|uniref:Uncharacterized protein n=1 Tax=Dactylonectria macrodidyma TaxID=307937 RepID=A0A9P9DRY2_9HYPO|nr:hypothetical protein EDB81DRAFT_811071 [Dactylonectria macrodidyma]
MPISPEMIALQRIQSLTVDPESPSTVFDDPDGVHSAESTTLNANETGVPDVVIGSPRSAPHSAIDAPTPARESPAPCLAHLDLDEAFYQGDNVPASGTPICHDPETPHRSPKRRLSQDSSEGQDLGLFEVTKPGPVASDAIRTATPISSSPSVPDSATSARTSQLLIIAPLETVEAPDNSGDVLLSVIPSHCSSIPGTRDASPERQLSLGTPQGHGLETNRCGTSDTEAKAFEVTSGSSPTRMTPSPSLGPVTRRRSRRKVAHRLMPYDNGDDSDADSASQGSAEDLDHMNLLRDEDYHPSLAADKRGQDGAISDEDEQCPHKRRKVPRPSASLMRHEATRAERSRRGRASFRSTAQSAKGEKRSKASGIPTPASSQTTSTETELGAVLAKFEEWPLENVSLKRIIEHGRTTF